MKGDDYDMELIEEIVTSHEYGYYSAGQLAHIYGMPFKDVIDIIRRDIINQYYRRDKPYDISLLQGDTDKQQCSHTHTDASECFNI